MSKTTRLTQRGPNATSPAKLPGLQAIRLDDPQVQKAFEALREWVEVRLGSRGDIYEKAVTLREFEQRLEDVFSKVAELAAFNGQIESLQATERAALPSIAAKGSFVLLDNGELHFGDGKTWRKFTLT